MFTADAVRRGYLGWRDDGSGAARIVLNAENGYGLQLGGSMYATSTLTVAGGATMSGGLSTTWFSPSGAITMGITQTLYFY
jgi:hypothetical protein